MMYVNGDLIKLANHGDFDIIIHGCNCFCTMGAGIAKAIKQEFPSAYFEADLKTQKGLRNKLGTYSLSIERGLVIINAYTQYTYWDKNDMLDYSAVLSVFQKIKLDFDSSEVIPKIGIPKIGAGLAGGDWERIEELIESCNFRNLTCVVL